MELTQRGPSDTKKAERHEGTRGKLLLWTTVKPDSPFKVSSMSKTAMIVTRVMTASTGMNVPVSAITRDIVTMCPNDAYRFVRQLTSE